MSYLQFAANDRTSTGVFGSTYLTTHALGVMMMPGLMVLIRAPRLPQRTASAITRSELPRLES